MIHAGSVAEIFWGDGNWIFLDIGFSSRNRTCGLLVGGENPRCLRFAEAEAQIKQAAAKFITVNLVVEAPLSVCFNASGNPVGRSIEKEGGQARYWYIGPGCAVMVASMYLLRDFAAAVTTPIRLFEGFVSYKRSKPSSHGEDVIALREVVRDPVRFQHAMYEGNGLKNKSSDELFSAFRVLGLDCGVPAVIKPPGDLRVTTSPPAPASQSH
jgi:hypothetical protein